MRHPKAAPKLQVLSVVNGTAVEQIGAIKGLRFFSTKSKSSHDFVYVVNSSDEVIGTIECDTVKGWGVITNIEEF